MILNANALHIPLKDKSVYTCVTSPPYWSLRDYQVDGQLGLEPTPEEYVANMVSVFREVWRVLRDDGTLFLNLGDSYFGSSQTGGTNSLETNRREARMFKSPKHETGGLNLKPKDLCGIPWRVAFALQADGWYLRSDIIWHKPNPMPESVTDRPTKSHEYIFLLSKQPRYYYDADAVREKNSPTGKPYGASKRTKGNHAGFGPETLEQRLRYSTGGRNRRTVWTVTTKPYSGAHFATFPPDLIEPCILAGCPETVCAECGAGYVRVVEKPKPPEWAFTNARQVDDVNVKMSPLGRDGRASGQKMQNWLNENPTVTTGFSPTCDCNGGTTAGIVFDPFFGSGTTGMVAIKHKRRWVGLDLSAEYIELAKRRTSNIEVRLF